MTNRDHIDECDPVPVLTGSRLAAFVEAMQDRMDKRDGKIHTDPPNRAESPRERHRRKLRAKHEQRKSVSTT